MSLLDTVLSLNSDSPPQQSLDFFDYGYQQLHNPSSETLRLSHFENIPNILKLDDLNFPEDPDLLNELVSVKLNGGLGTSLKSKSVKSCLNFNNSETILEKYINEMKDLNVTTVLMNSPHTHKQTMDYIKQCKDLDLFIINQSKFPRICKSTLEPFQSQIDENRNWNPIGHAEIYSLLYQSGLLQKFKDANKKYLFISNIDNIYATINLQILHYLHQHEFDFLMEVTPKTNSDLKGGILVKNNSNIKLIELAQLHKDDLNEFYDLSNFNIFNTNNIWVSIDALIRLIETNKLITDTIYNTKIIEGNELIQIESAMGSAVQSFDRSTLLEVPRSRFFPIKTINDLFLLRSIQNAKLKDPSNPPLIHISDSCESVDQLETSFQEFPDLSDCKSFQLTGRFQSSGIFTVEGDVSLSSSSQIIIDNGSYFKNCMVTYD